MNVKKEVETLRRVANLLEENDRLRQLQASHEPESGGSWGGGMMFLTIAGLVGVAGYAYLQGGLF